MPPNEKRDSSPDLQRQTPVTTWMGDRPWYTALRDGEAAHHRLWGLFQAIAMRSQVQIDNTKRLMACYQWGAKIGASVWDATNVPMDDESMYFNAAQDVVDTVHAKVCKTKIRPMPLTDGGQPMDRRRARDLGRAMEGVFSDNNFEAIKEDVVSDALKTDHGAGALLVYWDYGQVILEHVPIDDLFFDEAEVRYRKPRSLFRRIYMDRYVVLAKYGIDGEDADDLYGDAQERRRAILAAPKARPNWQHIASDHEQIELVEAYHLRSRAASGEQAGSDDGRHALVVSGGTLFDREWNQDRFPIPLYVPRPRMRNIWGISLMRALIAPQREYETLGEKIQRKHHRMGGAHFAIPKGANVDARELDNGVGTAFEFEGNTPPLVFNPEPCNPQTYQYFDSIPSLMSRRGGVSDLSVSSQLPAGLRQASGKALQVFDDFEAERLLPYHTPLERWVIAVMWAIVDCVRAALAENQDLVATYRSKSGLERYRWRDLLDPFDADDQTRPRSAEFRFEVFPVSNLAKSPAARFAQLTELLNAGAITVEQFKRLYEIPDLAAENELDTADTDVIDKNMDAMILSGRYISPEPFDNLELIRSRAGKYYNLCRQQDVPEDRLDLLRQYIEDAQSLLDAAKSATAAIASPPQPEAPAPPASPPPEMPGMPGMAGAGQVGTPPLAS